MKFFVSKMVACLAIFNLCSNLHAANPARALVLYNEPPSSYVTALEIVTLNPGSVAYSIAVLPDGKKLEIPRAGIIAVIDYPPQSTARVTEQEAAAALQKIASSVQKYPQYRTKLDAASAKWNNALAIAKKAAKTTTAQSPIKNTGPELEIDGVKYLNVALVSFTGTEVAISHADGVAKIPATTLTASQIAVLNATNTAIRIDAAQVVKPPLSNAPPGNMETNAPSITASVRPEVTAEMARLNAALSTSEVTVRNLQAEETNLRGRMESMPVRSRSDAEYYALERRRVELSDERSKAETRYDQANAKMQKFKVEFYRAAAVLPPTSTDWEALVRTWTAQVAEQTKVADAAENACKHVWNTQLNEVSHAEREKLDIAKRTLAQAQRQSDESKRETRVEKERLARSESEQLRNEKRAENIRTFKSLPVNNEAFVPPFTAATMKPTPSIQRTSTRI